MKHLLQWKKRILQVVCEVCIWNARNRIYRLEEMVENLRNPNKEVKIALVGKYTQLHDAYFSVVEALKHGGISSSATVDIKWIDSENCNRRKCGSEILR